MWRLSRPFAWTGLLALQAEHPLQPPPDELLDGSAQPVYHQPEAPSYSQGIEDAPAPRSRVSLVQVPLERPLVLLVRQPQVEPRPPCRVAGWLSGVPLRDQI